MYKGNNYFIYEIGGGRSWKRVHAKRYAYKWGLPKNTTGVYGARANT